MSMPSDSRRAHCLTGGWASTKVRCTSSRDPHVTDGDGGCRSPASGWAPVAETAGDLTFQRGLQDSFGPLLQQPTDAGQLRTSRADLFPQPVVEFCLRASETLRL